SRPVTVAMGQVLSVARGLDGGGAGGLHVLPLTGIPAVVGPYPDIDGYPNHVGPSRYQLTRDNDEHRRVCTTRVAVDGVGAGRASAGTGPGVAGARRVASAGRPRAAGGLARGPRAYGDRGRRDRRRGPDGDVRPDRDPARPG